MIDCKTGYEKKVRGFAANLFGGMFNAHAHADRAFTREDRFYTHQGLSIDALDRLSLEEKQQLTWVLHTGIAFEPECIEERMRRVLDDSIKFGVTSLDTSVDVTYNTRFKSLEIAEKLKKEYADRIKMRIGAYNISGFKNSAPERFEIFEEAAKRADFLVGLPEKDRYPDHIGERQHNNYLLNLAIELGKPLQVHVDQGNDPDEARTEELLSEIHEVFDIQHRLEGNYPKVSAVHVISPSCYREDRFKIMCDEMLKYDVEVICCPAAAISMKQDRTKQAPIHNSIARVGDFIVRGVPVKFGTDNIEDIYMPTTSADLYDDTCLVGANGIRVYGERGLAKLLAGQPLDDFDRGKIGRELGLVI
jgi:cytosine/adenosine deaminase-related metal-dependent hydrolase